MIHTHTHTHIHTMEYYSAIKRWNLDICYNMDGPSLDGGRQCMISCICGIKQTNQNK